MMRTLISACLPSDVNVVVGFYHIHPKMHKSGQPRCDSQSTRGREVCLLQIARELRDSSPMPRRVVIATPARKVGEAKGTYQAGGSTPRPQV